MKAYSMLKATFKDPYQAKEIKVRYFVIDALSSYNMIIGRPPFDQLGAALSTLYLCMNYPLYDGRVGVSQRDCEISIKCYTKSFRMNKFCILGANNRKVG